jgi:2-oxoglutarate dehydrogenase E2 component (dihydrolipoamide succinyltransferase)
MEATYFEMAQAAGRSREDDETVLEIATDKVDTEVPSIAEGIIEQILYRVNACGTGWKCNSED